MNGVVTLLVPLSALALRADWGRRVALDVGSRFAELARAAALPIVLQAFFVVCLRFASGLGTGAVTSFTYAYFVAARSGRGDRVLARDRLERAADAGIALG